MVQAEGTASDIPKATVGVGCPRHSKEGGVAVAYDSVGENET